MSPNRALYELHPGAFDWRPVPAGVNLIFAGQRSYEEQRLGYHPLSAKHPGKMLPDLAAILLATFVAPMARRLGRPPVVLDLMAGIGTTLVEAIKLGLWAIGVELEAPWAQVAEENCRLAMQAPGAGRGWVLQGDARDVQGLLAAAVEAGLFSPPYGSSQLSPLPGRDKAFTKGAADLARSNHQGYAADAGLMSPPYGPIMDQHAASMDPEKRRQRLADAGYDVGDPKRVGGPASAYTNQQNYDAGLLSPPYGPALGEGDHGRGTEKARSGLEERRHRIQEAHGARLGAARSGFEKETPGSESATARLGSGYVQVDAGAFSPPYGDIRQDGGPHQFGERGVMTNYSGEDRIKKTGRKQDNLGNIRYGDIASALAYLEHLRGGGPRLDTGGEAHTEAKARGWAHYLAQMVPVYLGYHAVIRPGGVLIVVVRNFRRDRREVDLVGDTVRLCEAAGFQLHATIPCITSAVNAGPGGAVSLEPRVSPFRRVNARRRAQEEGVPQLLEVYEVALVFKRPGTEEGL